ncbi:MAG: hypothetical protein GY769_23650 [bacterium]|nr:hypothetical protein [bacterium]
MTRIKPNSEKSRSRSVVLAVESGLGTSMLLTLLVLALAAWIASPLGATTTDAEADAYGFVSRVEGDALLAGLEGDDAVEAEINHPLLTGDQITTNSGRIEVVLPDGSIVRVGRGTTVVFETLAGAPDSPDAEIGASSYLTLDEGELQIRTPETFYGGEELIVGTANATIYLAAAGNYRIAAQSSSFSEVVVREGFAEADTQRGSGIARAGEALEISGYGRPFVNVVEAGPADGLELWAGDLDRAAYESVPADVDPRLAYAAAPLRGSGEWIVVESRRVWRPYVRVDWRPFRYGRWVYTPSGLTWVASAPWGWVTSHYGSWDYVPGYGWLWLPGNVYLPGGVYWYWGPTHVAWIPLGYYNRHYRSGFRFGVYGWAGGDWSYWADWTFCPTRYFGRRGYDRYWNSGRNLARERRFAVPRGIVTTDTRGLGPDRWGKPTEAMNTLVKRIDPRGGARSLPDVTDFVARRELADAYKAKVLGRETSARERLRPLPEESNRGRFTTRSVSVERDTGVRSSSGTRRIEGLNRDRSGTGSSSRRRVTPRTETGSRAGTRIREAQPPTRTRAETRDDGEPSQSSSRVRSLEGSRTESRDRPIATESTPARRVLDRIRAHRETTRGSSKDSRGKSSSAKPPSRSSQQSQSKSKSVSRSSSARSSKAPARGSGSSARGSGSRSSSVKKASPPSRSSGSRASGSKSRSRSRSKN